MRYSIELTSASSFNTNSLSKALEVMKLDEEYVLCDHLYKILIPVVKGNVSLDSVNNILGHHNRGIMYDGVLAPTAASLIAAGILDFHLNLVDEDIWGEILMDYKYKEAVMNAVHKSIVVTIASDKLLDYYVGHSDNLPEAIALGEVSAGGWAKAEGIEVGYNLIDTRYSVGLPLEQGELVFSELVDYIECGMYIGEIEDRYESTIEDLINASIIDDNFEITDTEGWAWLVELYS